MDSKEVRKYDYCDVCDNVVLSRIQEQKKRWKQRELFGKGSIQ